MGPYRTPTDPDVRDLVLRREQEFMRDVERTLRRRFPKEIEIDRGALARWLAVYRGDGETKARAILHLFDDE